MHISSDYKIIKLAHAFAMALQCCPNSLDWITEINKFKKRVWSYCMESTGPSLGMAESPRVFF